MNTVNGKPLKVVGMLLLLLSGWGLFMRQTVGQEPLEGLFTAMLWLGLFMGPGLILISRSPKSSES